MPLFQIGYRRYEGERTPHWRRWFPITRTGLAIAWRSKLLRRLVYFSFVPFLYFVLMFFFAGRMTDPGTAGSSGMLGELLGPEISARIREDPTELRAAIWSLLFALFGSSSQLIIGGLVAAIVGPRLISEDIRSKGFLIYFARPVSPLDYVAGKAGVLITMLATVTLLPSMLLYGFSILFSPSLDTLVQTAPVALSVALASLGAMIPTTLIVLAISSLTRQPRFATAAWVVLCTFGMIAHGVMTSTKGMADSGWAFMLSIPHSIQALQLGMFNVGEQVQELGVDPETVGLVQTLSSDYPPMRVAIWLACVSVACFLLLLRRVDAPTRI